MDNFLTFLVVAFFAYLFYQLILKPTKEVRKHKNQVDTPSLEVDSEHQENLLAIQRAKHNFTKQPVLNATERRVFFKFRTQLQKKGLNLYCQPQTTLAAFIRYDSFLKGMCGRADILITTTNFDAHSIIEINGTGHHTIEAAKRMEIKRSICDAVGVPIYAIEVTRQMSDEEIEREVSRVVERLA